MDEASVGANPPGAHGEMQDSILHRMLIQAAWEHDADWLLGMGVAQILKLANAG